MTKNSSNHSDHNLTDSWFTNLTDIHIPPSVAKTVSLGKNIPCADCTACYIGTTKRPLKNRILEHKKDVHNPPDKWTVLTKHAWHQDHTFDFDNVQIVDRSDNYKG